MVNGLEDLDMGKEQWCGQMAQNMRENGSLEKLMEKVFLHIVKAKCMMDFGYMIKPMALGYILTQMELNIKDIGTRIYSMAKGMKNGLMVQNFKVNTEVVRKMGWANIYGLMGHVMKANGKKMK
jgi:hypothetical protein